MLAEQETVLLKRHCRNVTNSLQGCNITPLIDSGAIARVVSYASSIGCGVTAKEIHVGDVLASELSAPEKPFQQGAP
jgi:hypothetical protein